MRILVIGALAASLVLPSCGLLGMSDADFATRLAAIEERVTERALAGEGEVKDLLAEEAAQLRAEVLAETSKRIDATATALSEQGGIVGILGAAALWYLRDRTRKKALSEAKPA